MSGSESAGDVCGVKGGYGRQVDGTAGLTPAPKIPVRPATYVSCHNRTHVPRANFVRGSE